MLPKGFLRHPISRYALPALALAVILYGLVGDYTIVQAPASPARSNSVAPALAGDLVTPTRVVTSLLPPTAAPSATPGATPTITLAPDQKATPRVLTPVEAKTLPPTVDSKAAFVMDADTGETLFELNPDRPLPNASTTKIMTALLALERGKLDAQITASEAAATVGESTMYLQTGETLSLEELLYGLMLPSGNDAAIAIAEYIAGSEQGFVDLMNQRAAELGMQNTHFASPHGLPNPDHHITARDMAKLTREAMRHSTLVRIVSTDRYIIPERPTNKRHDLRNVNPVPLWYVGADGVKPGWTEEAGLCQVVSAVRNGHRIVAVVLNTPDLWHNVRSLLDYGFAKLDLASPSPYLGLGQNPNTTAKVLDLWNGYKAAFVQEDGRVIDPKEGVSSTGQAETLRRAVWLNDQPTFDKVAAWTEANLSRALPGALYGDNLYARHWNVESSRVDDWTNTTGADETMAISYVFAYKQWRELRYLAAAKGVIRDLLPQNAFSVNYESYLSDSSEARSASAHQVKLSGLHPAYYRIFAQLSLDSHWFNLLYTSYNLLGQATAHTGPLATEVGLPPSFVRVNDNGAALPASDTSFGPEAGESLWNFALDYAWYGKPQPLSWLAGDVSAFFKNQWATNHGAIPTAYQHDGTVAEEGDGIGLSGAALSALLTSDTALAQQTVQKIVSSAQPTGRGAWFKDQTSVRDGGLALDALPLANNQSADLWEMNPSLTSALDGLRWRYYPKTAHTVRAGFLSYFDQYGGLPAFGYPLTEEVEENGRTVQYFERARFEYFPELAGTTQQVQLSLLGSMLASDRIQSPTPAPFNSTTDRQYFPETGHSVGYGFLNFFRTHGGVDLFGYPISEETQENGLTVQYFQRARFEYHSELKGTPYEVSLGLLGREYLQQTGR